MKQILLLPITLALFLIPALAQDNRKASFTIDSSAKCWFLGKANNETLLLKSVEQNSPNSNTYYELYVCKNGAAMMQRNVKGWAYQNTKRASFTEKQIEEIKQMLAAPNSQFLTLFGEPRDNKRFTTLIFFNSFEYQRFNYSGALPTKAQQVIEFVKAEIKKQQRSIYDK